MTNNRPGEIVENEAIETISTNTYFYLSVFFLFCKFVQFKKCSCRYWTSLTCFEVHILNIALKIYVKVPNLHYIEEHLVLAYFGLKIMASKHQWKSIWVLVCHYRVSNILQSMHGNCNTNATVYIMFFQTLFSSKI